MTQRTEPTGVLFICMGNICRSPLAEGVFRRKVADRAVADRFIIDSAGIGAWHTGEAPDHRARAVAARHGVVLRGTARQVTAADFRRFRYLLCADDENYECLRGLGAPADRMHMLLDFGPPGTRREVPDPYYGGDDAFELVYRLVDSACAGLLDHLLDEAGQSAAKPRKNG